VTPGELILGLAVTAVVLYYIGWILDDVIPAAFDRLGDWWAIRRGR
jgi:hypothetical protein